MLIIEIALGIVLAIIILANLEAIFAIGLWVIAIAIIAAIAIALLVFTFNSVASFIFVTLLIVLVYIMYSYTNKSYARETYLQDNRVPEKLLDLVKSNLGAKDLAIKWSTKDYEKEIKLDGFIIEFKQVTKNEKTGFLITVIKTINNNGQGFICALHTRDCRPSSFFVTSSTLIYGEINSSTSIRLSVSSFCEMKHLIELVAELNNANIVTN